METKEKLRRYLAAFNMSQESADRIAGVAEGRTFSYLSGRSKRIPDDYLAAVGSVNSIPVSWFTNGVDDWPGTSQAAIPGFPDVQVIPIMGSVPMLAGTAPIRIGEIAEQAPRSHQRAEYYVVKEDMLPCFRQGDMVLVAFDGDTATGGPIRLV